jgi:hypothetical protein
MLKTLAVVMLTMGMSVGLAQAKGHMKPYHRAKPSARRRRHALAVREK